MQLHIRKHGSMPEEEPKKFGSTPMYSARPLEEFEPEEASISLPEEHEEEVRDWKHSRKTPAILFLLAIIIFGMITYFAGDFNAKEKLTSIRIEGNHSLLTSEISSLAHIDKNQKFYDIDLKSIEARIEKHPLVRHAVLHREINPNAIIISITEREPIALVRTDSGEPALIDADNKLFWPKRLEGLRNPNQLMTVPLLSGITDKDSASLPMFTWLVNRLQTMNDSAMHGDIGELKRTPSGAFVMYTNETSTPIFLGAMNDENFVPTLEAEHIAKPKQNEKPLFERQLELLASIWKKRLKQELRTSHAMYVDARFDGQIIVKRKI